MPRSATAPSAAPHGAEPRTVSPRAEPGQPWWRFPMVWMVILGPVIVVVASFVTLSLAIRHPDPVLTPATSARIAAGAEAPAMQARNHAATPGR